jgi:hypothetical protein
MNNNSLDINIYKTYMKRNTYWIFVCIIVIILSIILIWYTADNNWGIGLGIGIFLFIGNSILYFINRDKKLRLEMRIENNKMRKELNEKKSKKNIDDMINEYTNGNEYTKGNVNNTLFELLPYFIKYIDNKDTKFPNDTVMENVFNYNISNNLFIKDLVRVYNEVKHLEDIRKNIRKDIINKLSNKIGAKLYTLATNAVKAESLNQQDIQESVNNIPEFINYIIKKFNDTINDNTIKDDTIKDDTINKDTKYDETRVEKYIESYHEKIINPDYFLERYNIVNAPDMKNDVWHYFNNSDNYKNTILSDDTINSTYTTDKLNKIYNGLNYVNAKNNFLDYVKDFLPNTINKEDYINLITKPIIGSNNYTTSSDINDIKTNFNAIITEYQNNTAAIFTKNLTLIIKLKKFVNETSLYNINILERLITYNNTISDLVKQELLNYIIRKRINQLRPADV